jgi:hypothetical protein
LLTLTGTLIGGVGGVTGAAAGFNEVTNNALGTVIKRLGIAAVAMCLKDKICLGMAGVTGAEIARQAALLQQRNPNLTEENALLLALTDYGASTITGRPASPLPPSDPMVNVPVAVGGGNTATPGTVLPGQGAPGYGEANPTVGNTSTTSPIGGAFGPNIMVSQDVGNGVKLYPDGSLRTPDGKFASVSGVPAPGTAAAAQFADLLRQHGANVVGLEMEVDGPLGARRYDIVTMDSAGVLHGIEIKTGGAKLDSYQEFSDRYINRFGANGTGRLAGKRVVSSTTVYLP